MVTSSPVTCPQLNRDFRDLMCIYDRLYIMFKQLSKSDYTMLCGEKNLYSDVSSFTQEYCTSDCPFQSTQ